MLNEKVAEITICHFNFLYIMKQNNDILTEHIHIYQWKNNLICYFEIEQNGKYKIWEFINHKLNKINTWKLK